jgi:hypothetical protein
MQKARLMRKKLKKCKKCGQCKKCKSNVPTLMQTDPTPSGFFNKVAKNKKRNKKNRNMGNESRESDDFRQIRCFSLFLADFCSLFLFN